MEILARDFSGDFKALDSALNKLISNIGDSDELEANLRYADFYNWEKNLARYILWRYENNLRSKAGNQWSLLSWNDVRAPVNTAVRYSLDHINPRNNPKNERLVDVPGDIKKRQKPFSEVWLHRLGNLVLDSISAGASKGDAEMVDRIMKYQNSILLSQKELINFAISSGKNKTWGIKSIHNREDILVDFCKNTWKI